MRVLLALALLVPPLAFAQSGVFIVDPTARPSANVPTTVGAGGRGLNVYSVNPAGAAVSIDGGTLTANQGSSSDGGTDWPVAAKQEGVWVVQLDGGVAINNFPATQPVSGTVAVSNLPATQPVSGTVAATQGTSPWVTSAAQSGTWSVEQAGTWTVQQGTPPWSVSGSVTASGTVTANQGTPNSSANRWKAQLTDGTDDALISAGGALLTDGSATTQPVSGTVAATQSGTWNVTNVSGTVSLPTGAASATNQTTVGAQTTKINDGTDTALVSAGGALLIDGSATTQPISGSVTVSGSVTANAGTNLNTSALALETTQTAMSAKLPATLGQKAMAASMAVVIASDQSAVPVSGTVAVSSVGGTVAATQSGTWTVQPGNTQNTTAWLTTDTPRVVASANNTGTCVSVTASTTVLASNASRRAYGFKASEANTDLVHCKLGATATTSNVTFGAGASWSQDTGAVYTGVIDCIAASGTQSVCPYELN